MNELDGPKPAARPLTAFGDIEDLDCRGRRVLLRADPFLLDTLSDPPAAPPPVSHPPLAGGEPGAAPNPRAPAGEAALARDPAPEPPRPRSTLEQLIELGARVIIAVHFTPQTREESGLDGVEALASRLSERLAAEVFIPDECVGDASVRVINELRQGQLCVLPDLTQTRSGGEQRNDEAFARALATSVDAYVLEAFSAAHLELASTVKLPRLVPRRALGVACLAEIEKLGALFALNRGSVGLLLGGSLFSEKIDTLTSWLPRVDRLCIGGSVALTLLAAAGQARSDAAAEPDRLAQARSLLARARDLGVSVTLPVDFRVQLEGDQGTLVKRPADIPPKARIIDIGPESAALFEDVLGKTKHLLWWGPLGNLRHPEGTTASAALAALCARPELMSVVIGGDTRRFVRQLPPELRAGIDLVSTGSEAARALLAGRRLPGIEALRNRQQ
jgi:phosphoglycerate kinase